MENALFVRVILGQLKVHHQLCFLVGTTVGIKVRRFWFKEVPVVETGRTNGSLQWTLGSPVSHYVPCILFLPFERPVSAQVNDNYKLSELQP